MDLKSYRNRFSYKLGATSYILPVEEDNLIQNVTFLKDVFDTVQLLVFGKDYINETASPSIIGRLKGIQEESGIIYTVHLPLDLHLLSSSDNELLENTGLICSLMNRMLLLKTGKFILHIDKNDYAETVKTGTGASPDRDRFQKILELLIKETGGQASKIAIENTFVDLTELSDVILESPFNICMDFGHLFIRKQDPEKFRKVFKNKISIIHIHGIDKGQDHKALNVTAPFELNMMLESLKGFEGTVIIEVFNEADLEASLQVIENFELNNKENL